MTTRITRLTCANCAQEQRVRVHVEGDTESYPWCPACGPTTWLAFPKLEAPGPLFVEPIQSQFEAAFERIFGRRWW